MTKLPESLRRVLDAQRPKPVVPVQVDLTTIWRNGTVIRNGKRLKDIPAIP